jgi:thiamine-monophosphate kinase
LGAGDDAAVVDAAPIVISADLSFEGIHFRRDWLRADEIGWRAAASALSDLAAMAAMPIGILASVAASPEDATSFARDVMSGVSEAAHEFSAELLGGDVSGSSGPFVIDVIVVGHTEHPVRRSGALPGDSVWITGELGGSAAALAAWHAHRQPEPGARRRFARPRPRIAEAAWLARTGALHALIDLSDGLAGDARHIAAASNVRIRLQLERIPIDPAAISLPQQLEDAADVASPLRLALAGGEDYELCFASPATFGDEHVSEFRDRFGIRLTRVGSVVEGEGVVSVDEDGQEHALEMTGYSHL